jgi:phosphatidate phosphatase LPIN
LRQEFPEEQEQLYDEIKEKFNLRRMDESQQFRPINDDQLGNEVEKPSEEPSIKIESAVDVKEKDDKDITTKDEGKGLTQSKKKRRKKSMIKKKNSLRKNSTSSSTGSNDVVLETETIENNSGSSNDNSPNNEHEMTKEMPINDIKNVRREPQIHFFSDGEAMSPQGSRPNTPIQSDTEFEVSQREKMENGMTSSASWKWGDPVISDQTPEEANTSETNKRNSMLSGMLSFMKQKRKSVPDGLYLSDLDLSKLDPEIAALYFPKSDNVKVEVKKSEDDGESGNGTSVPHSPTTSMEMIKSISDSECEADKQADSSLNFVALSLCGMEKGLPTEEEFTRHSINYSDICLNPSLFSSPNLVVRLNNKYYTWMQACPIVMTLLAYQKPLPNDACEKLINLESDKLKIKELNDDKDANQTQAVERRGWFSGWRRSGGSVTEPTKKTPNKLPIHETIDGVHTEMATQTSPLSSPQKVSDHGVGMTSLSSEDSFLYQKTGDDSNFISEKFRKTLRLSSQQIECLNLKSGMNEVEFSVTTAYQGTSRCKCYLFKWKYNDKVVISDIDGTITKSDVLGHILPMVGKDWAQIGVAQLFSKIEENGYKMLYLSARAIGQSRATREYLRSIRQGDVQLPGKLKISSNYSVIQFFISDGPLLLNPTSLISAFHREVIERKPEQFKIECLSDIRSLFQNKNPFYAGYGNRINVIIII